MMMTGVDQHCLPIHTIKTTHHPTNLGAHSEAEMRKPCRKTLSIALGIAHSVNKHLGEVYPAVKCPLDQCVGCIGCHDVEADLGPVAFMLWLCC